MSKPYGGRPKVFYAEPSEKPQELIVTEGDSAAAAVAAVRDPSFQTVVALQGKPINCRRATNASILANPAAGRLIELLGGQPGGRTMPTLDPVASRFCSVAVLMDPDADGIHCAALAIGFFSRVAPAWIDAGRVRWVHPPMFQFIPPGVPTSGPIITARDDADAVVVSGRLRDQYPGVAYRRTRLRGLGSIAPTILAVQCTDPATRVASVITAEAAEQMAVMFGW